ncbi:MAG: DnaT-like ssDNA-binding protein [Magnetospiraceae bacterium]
MALIVEDGSGKTDAESYVTLAEANIFWAARNDAVWADAGDLEKEAALRAATEYLDVAYVWKGVRVAVSQALAWPRYGVVDRDGFAVDYDAVPDAVRTALNHLAHAALGEDLLPAEDAASRIKRQREKVDVIETETEYAPGTSSRKRFPLVDRLVENLTRGRAAGLVGTQERA